MNRQKSSPLLFIAGIALIISGMISKTNTLWIVGIVFIIIGMAARRKLTEEKKSDTD